MEKSTEIYRVRFTCLLLTVLLIFITVFTACVPGIEADPSMPNNTTNTSVTGSDIGTPAPVINNNGGSETVAPTTNNNEIKPTETNPVKAPEVIRVTVSAVGDCTLGINYSMAYKNSFDAVYDRKGKSYFFKNVYDILSNDDFTIANLEGPLTRSRDRQAKLYSHRGKPEYVNILTAGSVEAVSFSNNHTYDFGKSGYEDTVKLLSNAEIAYACDGVYGIYETKGIKIGFVSVNEHYDGKLVEVWLENGITNLRQQGADLVIAAIHWGRSENEKTSNVDDYQIELGNKCIDWGYDLVIGNHVHVLEGINKYKGKYIAYSLGNFSYGGSKNPVDKDSGIFQQTFTFIDGELQVDDLVCFIPCSSSSSKRMNNYQPTVSKGEEAKRIITKMNTYSAQYGVVFDLDGYLLSESILTEQNKADAYYSIFNVSFQGSKPVKSVKEIGVDISLLGLSDTTYLESLIGKWCTSNGYSAFFGTKGDLVAAGYNKKAADGKAAIIIFDPPQWSNHQVQCTVLRNITLLNYLREDYTSAYASDKWVTVKGTYISTMH